MQLNYGILSTSSIAPRFIAAVRDAKAGSIVALSSRTLEKADEKAKEWNIPKAYGSHEALLEDEDVNIVYISTVNSLHYKWAKAALQKGKHVICEKPCTTSETETRELFSLAREKGLFFMEAQKMLFLPAVQALKNRIESGSLGDIRMVELSSSFAASYNGWMFDKSAGGGPLLSSGIYGIQLMLWLFGSIKQISGLHSAEAGEAEWQYAICGETESGVLFTLRNSTRASLENAAVFYGSKGNATLPSFWKARKAVFTLQGQPPEVVEFPCQHELVYEAKHILECMQKGLLTSPVATEELATQGIAAIEKIKSEW